MTNRRTFVKLIETITCDKNGNWMETVICVKTFSSIRQGVSKSISWPKILSFNLQN